MNYRCTFPIQVRKNLLNANSPTPLNSGHKLTTTLGQFSFAKAHISTRYGATTGNSYTSDGAVVGFDKNPGSPEG